MGRSRRRAARAGAAGTATTGPAPRAAERKRAVAAAAAAPDTELLRRRTLATYLAGAMVLAVLVLLGTVMLQGTLGPWIVLVVAAGAAYGLHRWAFARLLGVELSGEDRTLRTMASGLLILVLGFAAVAAGLLTVMSL
jgi:hypothetical protein